MPDAPTPDQIQRHIETVNRSEDRKNVIDAAIALARSEDGVALMALNRVLGKREFLDRLDPPKGEDQGIANLARVFRALAQHPTRDTARLCESIYSLADFAELPARINLLLGAWPRSAPLANRAPTSFAPLALKALPK